MAGVNMWGNVPHELEYLIKHYGWALERWGWNKNTKSEKGCLEDLAECQKNIRDYLIKHNVISSDGPKTYDEFFPIIAKHYEMPS